MSSPKPKWSARMGSVMRRTSSVLTLSRPATPSIASDHEADASSLKLRNEPSLPSLLPPAVAHHSAPSPIAESPAREAAASELPPIGPSPLAQDAANDAGPAVTTESPDPIQEVTSPVGYTPPPVLDSSAGNPGAFTDEPEELPQPQVIVDPFSSKPASTAGHESIQGTTEGKEASEDIHAPVEPPKPVEEPQATEQTSNQPPVSAEIHPEEPQVTRELPIIPTIIEPPKIESTPSYFEQQEEQPKAVEQPPTEFVEAVQENQPAAFTEQVEEVQEAQPAPIEREVPAESRPRDLGIFYPGMPGPQVEQPATAPSAPIYALPTYDIHSDQEIWGGVAHMPSHETREVDTQPNNNEAAGGRMPMNDPFADPLVPRITVSPEYMSMPQPEAAEQHQQMPEPHNTRDEPQGSMAAPMHSMPLPPFHEVIPSQSIHHGDSTTSLAGSRNIETDERRPLLQSPKGTSYLQPSTFNHVTVSPQSPNTSSSTWHSSVVPRLHDLGWLEYHLPDGTFYYVHPTRRITTDINLRAEKMLHAVTAYFDEHKDSAPVGAELWLRDIGTNKRGFVPARCWVDHHARTVILDWTQDGKGKRTNVDDQLDMEYRYWSFMESHPAHSSLPTKAKTEAMDALTWAWTDRLLPSQRAFSAPFTQEECQELMSLLRSFSGENNSDLGIQTRIVSRILIRVVQWRQTHFRPNKPLPKDINTNDLRLPSRRRPFRRALVDLVISIVCLGIPYMFIERTRNHRMDEESGLRSAGPFLMIGACTCLMAAIVLSASVTFLSLPGLDSVARIAGLVAILFASFAMASTIISVFKFKADMERPISYVGIQGLALSKRSIIFSLPLVCLAYSLIGFTTGIVLYSVRGVSVSDPSGSPFDDYTKWTVVGVLGALAGMLTTSLLLLRR